MYLISRNLVGVDLNVVISVACGMVRFIAWDDIGESRDVNRALAYQKGIESTLHSWTMPPSETTSIRM